MSNDRADALAYATSVHRLERGRIIDDPPEREEIGDLGDPAIGLTTRQLRARLRILERTAPPRRDPVHGIPSDGPGVAYLLRHLALAHFVAVMEGSTATLMQAFTHGIMQGDTLPWRDPPATPPSPRWFGQYEQIPMPHGPSTEIAYDPGRPAESSTIYRLVPLGIRLARAIDGDPDAA